MTRTIRVIGLGNSARGDDVAGLRVAERLRGRLPQGVGLVSAEHLDGAGLIEAWADCDCAVVVDALRSGAPVGSVHCFDAGRDRLPPGASSLSSHGLGLAAAVELGRILGRLPRRLVVIGVEGRRFRPGDLTSPELEGGIDEACARVLQIVDREQPAPPRRPP